VAEDYKTVLGQYQTEACLSLFF